MKIEFYKAKDGWRWRLRARNGRILAESGEAYSRKGNLMRALDRMGDVAFYRLDVVRVAK